MRVNANIHHKPLWPLSRGALGPRIGDRNRHNTALYLYYFRDCTFLDIGNGTLTYCDKGGAWSKRG